MSWISPSEKAEVQAAAEEAEVCIILCNKVLYATTGVCEKIFHIGFYTYSCLYICLFDTTEINNLTRYPEHEESKILCVPLGLNQVKCEMNRKLVELDRIKRNMQNTMEVSSRNEGSRRRQMEISVRLSCS